MQRAGLQNELFFTFSGKYIQFFKEKEVRMWTNSIDVLLITSSIFRM